MRMIARIVITLAIGSAIRARAEEPPAGESTTANTDEASEGNAEELAKKTQNPVADLYSFPFQDNIGFNYGPTHAVQNVMNFQPVIPLHFGPLNVITRTIFPIITQPSFVPGQGGTTGLGDITFTAFLSPAGGGTDLILAPAAESSNSSAKCRSTSPHRPFGTAFIRTPRASSRTPIGP